MNLLYLAPVASILLILSIVPGGNLAQGPDAGVNRGRQFPSDRPAVPGIHGLVTAGHPLAAMAGCRYLLKEAMRSPPWSRGLR